MSALDEIGARRGRAAVERLLLNLVRRAAEGAGARVPVGPGTPYVNTIPARSQPRYPGDLHLERRIERLVRYNAMAMVVRANRAAPGIGGHISTFASAATLFEVGFNHFFKGRDHEDGGDVVYFQGHASPGVYARAFLEGRLSETQLGNFRRELAGGGGLPSYPHPFSMPEFWERPSVSMGLAPLMAIYQARFNRYLEARGLAEQTGRVWALVGDGEMDEPESIGAIDMAVREGLSNLTLVVNCNLQRLDGPVRGSGKFIQELEHLFEGAGWRVIKVIWGSSWDPLLERDQDGLLVERMEDAVDGDYQKYVVEGGAYMREHFFGRDPRLLEMVEDLSDRDLERLERGGHDPAKVYAAYRAAVRSDRPTIILAKTVKGYGLGDAGEGMNIAHKTTELDTAQLRRFRDRFELPIGDDQLEALPFYRPPEDSPEMRYLEERRRALGGFLPERRVSNNLMQPAPSAFETLHAGTKDREATTTMLLVRLLAALLKDEQIGRYLVPIVPDEARTFGVEALFPQVGIYAPGGQKYEPVDAATVLTYREKPDGQILEEGVNEGGAISSFIAAGTSYATSGVQTVPFYFFYSMFGFQRVGDLIWAAGDARARGFLIGATSGRTTLDGEGLQHQDGHSHLVAMTHPSVEAYDPAFGYELAVIVESGLERMRKGEDVLFYITVTNEPRVHPKMPEDAAVPEQIVRGMYLLHQTDDRDEPAERVQILASGPILREAERACERLEQEGVHVSLFSVTSWKGLFTEAQSAERDGRVPFVRQMLGEGPGIVLAASDYVEALPATLGRWIPGLVTLGTDGFGISDTRAALRAHYGVDAEHIAGAARRALESKEG